MLEIETCDYFLSPAYDLINRSMHADGLESEAFKKSRHAGKPDFLEFGKRIGVKEDRIGKILEPFLINQYQVVVLTNRSFLSVKNKRGYLLGYQEKRNRLKGLVIDIAVL